jgi:DNA-3-methyladenine glycosylase
MVFYVSSVVNTPAQSTLVGRRWKRADFAGDSGLVAKRLLGHLLVRVLEDGTLLAGRIVETEAYRGVIDAASHAFRARRTARNEAMYARPGTSYVYFTYGMHFCMNVVCGEVDVPHAVLLRALEPVAGLEAMRSLRNVRPGKVSGADPARSVADRELCSGPARLCQAMAISREQNALDLVNGRTLFIAAPGTRAGFAAVKPHDIARTPRIGIDYAGSWAKKPLRFVVANSQHVSKRPRGGKIVKLEKRGKDSPAVKGRGTS